jgi:hypothetical protein
MKPSGGELPKQVTVVSAIQSASHPPPTGATVSPAPAVADALQHCHQAAVILESLKEREIDREGGPLFLLTRFFLLNSFTNSDSFRSTVLVKDLETTRKALSLEQSARSKAEQILQQSKDVNAALSLKLDNVETSLAITQNKLDSLYDSLHTYNIKIRIQVPNQSCTRSSSV